MQAFKRWLAERALEDARDAAAENSPTSGQKDAPSIPTFREWFDAREMGAAEGS
jgi:hypothetical protein